MHRFCRAKRRPNCWERLDRFGGHVHLTAASVMLEMSIACSADEIEGLENVWHRTREILFLVAQPLTDIGCCAKSEFAPARCWSELLPSI